MTMQMLTARDTSDGRKVANHGNDAGAPPDVRPEDISTTMAGTASSKQNTSGAAVAHCMEPANRSYVCAVYDSLQ